MDWSARREGSSLPFAPSRYVLVRTDSLTAYTLSNQPGDSANIVRYCLVVLVTGIQGLGMVLRS